jgi:hypothetical protein
MVDEGDSDDEDAALAKPLLHSQQLQRLALTGGDSMYVPVRLDWLAGAPQLQHLTACVVQSGQVRAACNVTCYRDKLPVRLHWLAGALRLQHLAACVVQSGQVGTATVITITVTST